MPIFYYDQFMSENGFYDRVDGAARATRASRTTRTVRDSELAHAARRHGGRAGRSGFQDALAAKFEADFPGLSMRFRSSTNTEDLDGFPCAGCYESHTGDPANGWDDVLDGDQRDLGGRVVLPDLRGARVPRHRSQEVGHGTARAPQLPRRRGERRRRDREPLRSGGLEPGFYVNVQSGGAAEVVHPPPGITSDQFLYYFDSPGQTDHVPLSLELDP